MSYDPNDPGYRRELVVVALVVLAICAAVIWGTAAEFRDAGWRPWWERDIVAVENPNGV